MRSFLLLPLLVFASISVAKPIEKRNSATALIDGALGKSKGPDIKTEGASPTMVLTIAYTNPHGVEQRKHKGDWKNFWSDEITELSQNTWVIAPDNVEVKMHGAPHGYTHLATIKIPATVKLDPTDPITKLAVAQIVGTALAYENNDPRLNMKFNGDLVEAKKGAPVVMPGAGSGAGVNLASAKLTDSTLSNTPSDAPLTGTNNANPNANTLQTNTEDTNTKSSTKDTNNAEDTKTSTENSD